MENRQTKSSMEYLIAMWNGDYFPSEKQKFNTICYALGAVHVIYAILFFILKAPLFAIYNIFSAYLFICTLTVLLRKNAYYYVFIIADAEISLFSLVFSILLGWNWGFGFFNIALCPVSFFITYSLPGVRRSFTRPALFSLTNALCFFVTKLICDHTDPFFLNKIDDTWSKAFYYGNGVVTFLCITVFSILFSMELRCKEKMLERNNQNLTTISSVDPLTGLLNRRAMMKILEEQVARTKTTGELFSLAIGDIDNFKMVNDIHGHNVGDDVLVMVSKTIKESLPEGATLCRWGGEEFLILIVKPENEAVPSIEAVRYAITQVSTQVDKPDGYIDLSVSMTFGVSQYVHGFSIDQVISLADENLYKGKASGKNKVVHSKSLT